MARNEHQGGEPNIPGTKGIWVVVVVLVVGGVAAFYWAWNHWNGMTERAQFGDLLSGVAGAVAFAGMAVALVLQTLELRAQRQELRLTRQELKETRQETKAQTDQFKAQAATMEEQVKVTKRQNELLERQLMLTHLPLLKMRWEPAEEGAALVIENQGHGQALIRDFRFKTPNWSGPSKETFERTVQGHKPETTVAIEYKDVQVGTLIDPHSTVVVLVVKASRHSMANYGEFSISIQYLPAQGGEPASLVEILNRIAELDQ